MTNREITCGFKFIVYLGMGLLLYTSSAFGQSEARGQSESRFNDVSARGKIDGVCSVTPKTDNRQEKFCLQFFGEFFVLVPDNEEKEKQVVSEYRGVNLEYVLKKFVGKSPTGKGDIFLAEGVYGMLADIVNGQLTLVGKETDGNFIYTGWISAPSGVREGYKYSLRKQKP